MAVVVDGKTFADVIRAAGLAPAAERPSMLDLARAEAAKGAASAARSARGRKARATGAEFEAEIMAGQLGPDGRPILRLVQLPGGGQFRGGRFVPVKSPFDFVGGFVRGPGLFFDAKAVDAASNRTGLEVHNPKIVKPQQIEALATLAAVGHLAGVLVRCGPLADYRWMPGLRLHDVRTIKWADARWVVLGPIAPGAPVPFAALLSWYARLRVAGGGGDFA